jgi:hypothetical protein
MTTGATYDTTTKVISASVAALFVILVIITRQWLVAPLGLLILFAGYAWSPRGYTVHAHLIVVHRLIGNAPFPLAGLREARSAAKEDFSGTIRLFGSGGLFGYYGVFSRGNLGRASWYLTNRRSAVVVVTDAKTALCSPDDREAFLAAVRTPA